MEDLQDPDAVYIQHQFNNNNQNPTAPQSLTTNLEDFDAQGEPAVTTTSPPDSYNPLQGLSPRPSDDFSTSGSKVRRAPPPPKSYPHPLDGTPSWGTAIPFKESYIRAFSAAVRDKPGWVEKILDKKLFVKWLREAQAKTVFSDELHRVLTWDGDDVGYVYEELVETYKPFVEGLKKRGLGLEPDLDGVWRVDGDDFVGEEVRRELVDAVVTLENVPDSQKDWHPGSNRQVLDLVHPSLYPIIYNRTLSATDRGPIRAPKAMESDREGFSNQFCWLPSEFEVSPDGQNTKIKSYINNLASDEQKKTFYPILEKIFTKFVPLFNHVLGDLKMEKHNFRRVFARAGYRSWQEGFIKLTNEDHQVKWDKLLDQFVNGEEMDVNFFEKMPHVSKRFDADDVGDPEFEGCDDSDDEDLDQRGDMWAYEVRDNMGVYYPSNWEPPDITDDVALEGKTVKVIVKMANIVLTPEKPRYKGGSWHVEAMLNERIVSTGIYYYDQENVTDSKLAFRRTVGNVPNSESGQLLEQNSDWPIVFNMSSAYQSWAVQEVGQIATKNKRAIAFPNIYQHRVKPFKLADPTKPGHRKIIVFFLCDPSPDHDIPTTRTVAPQQPEFRNEIEGMLRGSPIMGRMPEEVFGMINGMVPAGVTREKALKYRKRLMKERASFMHSSTMVQGLCYSLCEH
ncbi:hypothetical protein TWF730_008837 [Orbilia blumenaviensis]|uniref:Uncharacterized protein n=1 Tax=Orbilia blumenaviensis TaxID=1796055 RepID=A0AAV9V7C3_9PEZI